MQVNPSSQVLYMRTLDGKPMQKGELVALKKDGTVMLKIQLKNVYVSSYQVGGASGQIKPTAEISLNVGEMQTSGLSLSHRYHAGIRLRGSEYFQRKGFAAF